MPAVTQARDAGLLVIALDTQFEPADAADATNDRIDIVCVAENNTDDQSATRYIKNPTTGAVTAQTVNTRTSLGCTLNYVAGTPSGSPSAPARTSILRTR